MRKLVFILMASFCILACEKEVIDLMENYYTESMSLQSVTLDSVKSFSKKVSDYVVQNPGEKEHPLYPKIQENIKEASFRLTITIDTAWAGEKHVNF